jgi:membrane fusion protein (multidrug efflux system)
MKSENQKKITRYIPLVLIVLIVVVGGWFWYADYSKYIKTDDAYVDSDKVSVSSKVGGRIAKQFVEEGDTVKAGMLLVELDSSEMVAQRNQAISALNQMKANKEQANAKYDFDAKSIKIQEINYEKAKEDLERGKKQYDGKVISKETFDHLSKACESAKAQFESAKAQLEVSKAQIATSEASIQNANSQIKTLSTSLQNTHIYSPMSGIVAKRWLLTGDVTSPGQAIFTISDNVKRWVSVFIEETNLYEIKIGQPAIFTVDAFPNSKFEGKVFWIGSNTAAQFSLIPPSNASGNFTKITQRVPLKISIDKVTGSDSVQLLAGMSAVVKIIRE